VSVPEETLTAIRDTLRLVWSRELSADDGLDEIEILISPTSAVANFDIQKECWRHEADEWIKCSEQRPNVLDVWIKMTDGSVVACWSQLDGDFYWNGGGSESYILENTVTHWKPRQQEKDQ
jgi:hypothetical protein